MEEESEEDKKGGATGTPMLEVTTAESEGNEAEEGAAVKANGSAAKADTEVASIERLFNGDLG